MTAVSTARRILEMYWDYKIPVNLEQNANDLGVRVRYAPYLEGGEDISGRFDLINGQAICSIRSTDSEQRQRFTLAHELGHFALNHGGGFRDNDYSFKDVYDPREAAANRFAAELIMPEVAVNHLIQKENIKDIYELARWFNVSKPAITYRLRNLGWPVENDDNIGY